MVVVFGYGEMVHKMCMADLVPFSLNEKHLSVVWYRRCLRVSLAFPVFSQKVISRVFGAATCPSVAHAYLCCSRVRKNRGSTAQLILRHDARAMSAIIA